MRRYLIIILTLVVSLTGCRISRKVSVFGAYDPKPEVLVLYPMQPLPSGLQRIGTITVGNGGWVLTEYCTFESCLNTIVSESCKVGADVAKIIVVRKPYSIFLEGTHGLIDRGLTKCETSVTAELYIRKPMIDSIEEWEEQESDDDENY